MINTRLQKIKRDNNYNFDRSNFLRLDANERIIDFTKKEIKNIKKTINSYNIQSYPIKRNHIQNQISKKYKINANQISISPGSDSILKYAFEIISEIKGDVLSLYPTYGMINVYSKIYQKKIIKVDELNYSLLENKNTFEKLSLIYFAIPNMPSGKTVPSKILKKVLDISSRKKILFIIDEAYIDFSNIKTHLSLIKKYKNLLILKTFSKYYGLAGLRLGFFASSKRILNLINVVRPPHDLSSLSIEILNFFLKNNNKSYLNEIKKSKKFILEISKKNKLRILMTEANFFHIFIKTEIIKRIVNLLKKKKILVKSSFSIDRGSPYLGPINTIRVTIGSVKQMKYFFNIFNKIINKLT
jgi:histidinol-phosphate aminotransferase